MSDAKSIVEAVAFRALANSISKATVYQDAPVGAQGDLVILGDLKSFSMGGKGSSDDRRVEINIISLVVAEERAPLLALQGQIEKALDGQNFTEAGWTVAFAFQDDDAVLDEGGSSYSGISAFAAIALAP
ncbi:hypothetical protein AV944_00425 [Sphingomonas sp. LK11]|uniref:hypothetical protein n=1 Tax=Sphingomonas sp. LK11 TaxID=1390395 RepID=UPI0009727A35|nr:hypothetical protein [Sphingomonas sp. LK11]APX64565.1 hypothetical protein AV944_00425 [Sphingomonas sp. LK11]